MRRYIFSHGTVRVEEGIYRPLLKPGLVADRGAVLLLLQPPPAPHHQNAAAAHDKEHPPHDPSTH